MFLWDLLLWMIHRQKTIFIWTIVKIVNKTVTKFHFPSVYWGGGRNLRDQYLKTLTNKTHNCLHVEIPLVAGEKICCFFYNFGEPTLNKYSIISKKVKTCKIDNTMKLFSHIYGIFTHAEKKQPPMSEECLYRGHCFVKLLIRLLRLSIFTCRQMLVKWIYGIFKVFILYSSYGLWNIIKTT